MTRWGAEAPPWLWVAWTDVAGRPQELASEFGGRSFVLPRAGGTWVVLSVWRYATHMLRTVVAVAEARPAMVGVVNPPVLAALAAWIGASAVGARVVLDSHPGGFGRMDDRLSARFQWLHRWLIRHSAAVLVTTERLAELVHGWGGRPVLVHETPRCVAPLGPDTRVPSETSDAAPLAVATFARDEPVEVLWSAALRIPTGLRVTGDRSRAPKPVPAAVELTGFLPHDRYLHLLHSAPVAIVLTTDEDSVPRAGYEATYLGVPLILSDTIAAKRWFPHASLVPNDPDAVAAAVAAVHAENADAKARRLDAARRAALRTWHQQRSDLLHALQQESG